MVVTSERDHTALQFADLWVNDPRWRPIRESAHVVMLRGSDHTLSAAPDLEAFCRAVGEWLERPASRREAAAGVM